MPRALYFFSGFDPETGFSAEIAGRLRASMPKPEMLLLVASSPSWHEKTDRYAAAFSGLFERAGISFRAVHTLDDRTSPADAPAWLRDADCIFLMGGNPMSQMAFLNAHGYGRAILQSGAVLVGLSAGAINMGKTALCVRDEDIPDTHIYPGLAVADITVDPHFDPEDQAHLAELLTLSARFPIYAMRDGSAIVVEGGETVCYGEITLVDGGLCALTPTASP